MVSIIVPVYNKINHLDNCLKSIVGQTYSNIEVLLIDDGSTDGSDFICDQWGQRDHRITVVHQKNAGVSAARNVGICMANGEYITFVDADDTLLTTAISTMVEEIQKGGSDIWISWLDETLWRACNCDLSKYLLHKRKVAVWGALYKTELVNKVRFPEKLTNSEDFVFFFLLSLHTNNISGNMRIVYEHKLAISNSLGTHVSVRKLNSSLRALQIIEENLPDYLQQDYKIYKLYMYEYILTNLNGISSEDRKTLLVSINDIVRYVRQTYPQWLKINEKKYLSDGIKFLGFFLCPNFAICAISFIKERRNNGNKKQKSLE